MELNGLDLKSIDPKRGDKFSTNLYHFLKKQGTYAVYAKVYRDKDGSLWIGLMDAGDGWFSGSRLIAVLCNGARTQTYAVPPARCVSFKEVRLFWRDYMRVGRCVVDRSHTMTFIGDGSRWSIKGKHRRCKWCGKAEQKLVTRRKVVTKSEWVTI